MLITGVWSAMRLIGSPAGAQSNKSLKTTVSQHASHWMVRSSCGMAWHSRRTSSAIASV